MLAEGELDAALALGIGRALTAVDILAAALVAEWLGAELRLVAGVATLVAAALSDVLGAVADEDI